MVTAAPPAPVAFFVNRAIRRVPLTWQHPTDRNGQFIPLLSSANYTDEQIADLVSDGRTYEEVEAGPMPDFSAVPEDQMGLCVYETTSEGTPVSPVFPDTAEGREALL